MLGNSLGEWACFHQTREPALLPGGLPADTSINGVGVGGVTCSAPPVPTSPLVPPACPGRSARILSSLVALHGPGSQQRAPAPPCPAAPLVSQTPRLGGSAPSSLCLPPQAAPARSSRLSLPRELLLPALSPPAGVSFRTRPLPGLCLTLPVTYEARL